VLTTGRYLTGGELSGVPAGDATVKAGRVGFDHWLRMSVTVGRCELSKKCFADLIFSRKY
jgi:hypothetical protein